MDKSEVINLTSVQFLPIQPLVQLHMYEPMMFTHVALLTHGEKLHSLMSETKHKSTKIQLVLDVFLYGFVFY